MAPGTAPIKPLLEAQYIPSLQERLKWHKTQRNLQTGELVLIADDNVQRHQWPIGRVTSVFPGPTDWSGV